MAKTKTLFIAADDREFETEEACDAHDEYLRSAGNIEAYIVAKNLHKAQAGLMRTHLAGYLAFRTANPDASAALPVKKAAEKTETETEGAAA
jgi:hypothetical protein